MVVLASTLLIGACGDAGDDLNPPRLQRLLDNAVADREPPFDDDPRSDRTGEENGDSEDASTPTRVGNSVRQAIPCTSRAEWRAPVILTPNSNLEVTVTSLSGSSAEAIVDLELGSQRTRLIERRIPPESGWLRMSLDLPAVARNTEATIVLACAGDGEIAWSEAFVSTDSTQSADPPNLLLISLDTVRADHLTTYGYHRRTAPALDDLASRSLVFVNALSTSTWTLPTHATMFTGLLPDQHGVKRAGQALSHRLVTLTETLRDIGYRTTALTDGGFLTPRHGFSQGFDRYDTTPGKPWTSKDAATVLGAAVRWIEENEIQPFFLFVHTYETHQPYENRGGFADPFVDSSYRGRFQDRAAVDSLDPGHLSDDDVQRMVDLYDGELRRLDAYLGTLISAMRRRGLLDSTAILITSDHGEEFFEYGDIGHGLGKVFNEHVRVPMILYVPHTDDVGRFTVPVTTLDVVPTLLSLAGHTPASTFAGRSLVELARRGDDATRPTFVHGLNARRIEREERYRMDADDLTLVHDLVRSRSTWFDHSDDRSLRLRPLSAPPHGPKAETLFTRLQLMLTWAGDGDFAARLDSAAGHLNMSGASPLTPIGLWQDLRWRSVRSPQSTPDWTAHLSSGDEVSVVFEVDPRGGPARNAEIRIRGTTGERAVPLRTFNPSEAEYWSPLDGTIPGVGEVFTTGTAFQPDPVDLSEENRRELDALGYM